jgi:hypothetical protein
VITETAQKIEQEIKNDLAGIEMDVLTNVTVADLIRYGAKHTTQAQGWGNDETACALSCAGLAAEALGIIGDNDTDK